MSLVEGEAPIWLTSLQLLGFRELVPKVVSLTRNTFDHSNPVAFQQVFHFLLSQIVPARVKAECRDCWPILDKKQEAEFRRKVVMLVKEVQGTLITAPLPQVNPALFMSPGGHKFKAFLSNLATQVVRFKLGSERVILGLPHSSCKGPLRQQTQHRFRVSKARDLRAAVDGQDQIRQLEAEADAGLAEIEEEYFALKKELEELEKECSSVKLNRWEAQSKEEQEELLGKYDDRCKVMVETKNQLQSKSEALSNHFKEIMEVVNETKPKLTLDLTLIPKAWLHPTSLSSTYQGLCIHLVASLQKALSFPHPCLAAAGASEAAKSAVQQNQVLVGLQEEWKTMIREVEESLRVKLAESETIDWAKSGLAPLQEEKVSLPPPSPSLLPALSNSNTGLSLTPSLRISAPDLVPEDKTKELKALSTPEPQPQLTRRFPRKITPDQSPLLRQSLIQATLRSTENRDSGIVTKEEVGQNTQEEEVTSRKREDSDLSKDSLGVFSPVLSSTLAPQFSNLSAASSTHLSPNYIRNLRLPSEEVDAAVPAPEEDDTAAKILRYKQILGSQSGSQPQPNKPSSPARPLPSTPTNLSPSRASLAQEWRSSLASLVGGSADSSPSRLAFNTTPTPGAATEWDRGTTSKVEVGGNVGADDMDSILVSRLDMLMQNSMTLSDTSTIEFDLSLGALNLDPGLLSPHTK